jgi:DNA-binding NtrC family response regulator
MIRWSIEQTLRDAGHEVSVAETAAEGMALFRQLLPEVVFLDVRLPDEDGLSVLKKMKDDNGQDTAVIVMTAFGEIRTAVEAMRLGAFDYLKKPFDFEELEVIVGKALEATHLKREVGELRQERRKSFGVENIVGQSEKMRQVMGLLEKVAQSDATTVLLQGENGTGKDLFARAIHFRGKRADGPFVDISCTAMPDTLLESELFGHEKGAFTDAKAAKRGLLELADGGTLFLDEIGDMPLVSQVKLLKVIESRRFKRVGGTVDHLVDIRIIAATNRDLEAAVREGRFREDLYYRLKVIPIVIPPLRERRDDVPLLLYHYMEKYDSEFRKAFRHISEDALRLLMSYSWPGNVRELRNLLERILILENGDTILPEHLPLEITAPASLPQYSPVVNEGISARSLPASHPTRARVPPNDTESCLPPAGTRYCLPPTGVSLEEVEKDLVRQALEIAEGNQTRAAQLLGISRDALRYRMQKFGFAS